MTSVLILTGAPRGAAELASATVHRAAAAPRGSTALQAAGIPFGAFRTPDGRFGPPFTGVVMGGRPASILRELEAARAAHVHVMLRLATNRRHFQGADGAFSLELWKGEVDRFRDVDFTSYIADGTIIGHYLFDEPHDPSNWNGRPVPYADIEAAAAYSKQLWPAMPTAIRAPPSWLAAGAPWSALDMGWAQYSVRWPDPAAFIATESAAAQRAGLGVVAGLNVLDGGSGEFGVAGYTAGRSAMSPSEIERYSSALLADPRVCAFFVWRWDDAYFGRPEIQGAIARAAQAAQNHPSSSCRTR
ncbi:MAG TPA: hypothetical protein VFS44_03260 [Gemmatimonadaceae bacterium]|nr:hypothetical protein [Gemmatimonadaceae bacterium]